MDVTTQERQLVLAEALTKQLETVLANQKQLSATTDELKRQNAELKKALQESKVNQQKSTSRKRRPSSVEVPEALRVCII